MTERKIYALLVTTVTALSALLVGYNLFARPDVPMPVAVYLTPSETLPPQQASQAAAEHEERVKEILQSHSIDLNTADAETLTQLPRIGQVLAGRIVEYRSLNGPFTALEQLTQVKGIGEATLEALRPYVYLS